MSDSGTKLRLFIALEVPPKVRGNLSAVQEKLRQSEARVTWVKPDKMHLTLKFLGNVASDRTEDIAETLSTAVESFASFPVEVFDVGTFPVGRRARVVWAGIKKGGEKVVQLQAAVQKGMDSLGFPDEKRRFRPHLTIGRIKSSQKIGRMLELLKLSKNKKFGRFQVGFVSLIKSVLTSAGPDYTVLYKANLRSVEIERVERGPGRSLCGSADVSANRVT